MAIHFSILAWRIPRTKKPGGSSGLAQHACPAPEGNAPIPMGSCATFTCFRVSAVPCTGYHGFGGTDLLPGGRGGGWEGGQGRGRASAAISGSRDSREWHLKSFSQVLVSFLSSRTTSPRPWHTLSLHLRSKASKTSSSCKWRSPCLSLSSVFLFLWARLVLSRSTSAPSPRPPPPSSFHPDSQALRHTLSSWALLSTLFQLNSKPIPKSSSIPLSASSKMSITACCLSNQVNVFTQVFYNTIPSGDGIISNQYIIGI